MEPPAPPADPDRRHRRAIARRRRHAQGHGPGTAGHVHEQGRDNEALRHRLDLLLRRLYGRRDERFNPGQLLLFAEMAAGPETAPPTAASTEAQAPARAGRTAAGVCRTTCPASPGITSCPKPSALCPGCGQVASISARTRANNSTTGRRRCSWSSTSSTSMPAPLQPGGQRNPRRSKSSASGVRTDAGTEPEPHAADERGAHASAEGSGIRTGRCRPGARQTRANRRPY